MANGTQPLDLLAGTQFRPFTNGAAPATDPAQAGQQQLPVPEPVPEPAPTARRRAVLDFKERPFEAISLILGEISRGLEGKPSGVPALLKARDEQKALQVRQQEAGLKASKFFIDTILKEFADPGQQRVIAKQMERMHPGVPFQQYVDNPKEAARIIETLLSIDSRLTISKSLRERREIADNPDERQKFQDQSNDLNIDDAVAIIAEGMKTLEKNTTPEEQLDITKAFRDGVTPSHIPKLAEAFGLTPPQQAALQSAEHQAGAFAELDKLIPDINFVSGDVLEAEAGRKSLDRIAGEAEAQARGTATGKPDEPKKFKPFFNPRTGEIAGAREASEEAQRLVEDGFVPGRPPSGTVFTVDKDGNVTFTQGPDAGGKAVERATATAKVKLRNELIAKKSDVLKLTSRAFQLATQVREGGAGTISISGFASRFGEGLKEQAKSLADKAGFDFGNLDRFDFSAFGSDAVKSSLIKSNIGALAYMISNAQNERVTDADFQNAVDQLGAQTGDPESFVATTLQVVQNAHRDLEIDFQTQLDEPSNILKDMESLGLKFSDFSIPPENFIAPGTQGAAQGLSALSTDELMEKLKTATGEEIDRILAEAKRRQAAGNR